VYSGKNLALLVCVFMLALLPFWASAQDSDDELPPTIARRDTIKPAWTVRQGEKFDLVFNTGYLLTATTMPDSAPTNLLSGTTFVGLSFNYVLNKTWALKAQPGVAFYKLNFSSNRAKTFPTSDTSLSREKLRAFYIEVPIGVMAALSRDQDGRLQTWAELGATFGFRFNSSLKTSSTDANGNTYKLRLDGIKGFAPFRAGLYGKLGYKLIAVWAFYRLTDVFEPGAGYDAVQGVRRAGTAKFPEPPRFELGISIVL